MSQGLPPKLELINSGTNVYKQPDMGGAARQVQMLRQLTGGKKLKKGGNLQAIGGKTIVPQDPNANPSMNAINKNLLQISRQANANAKFDAQGGGKRRRKTKKTKRSRKRSKKTRRRRK